jgi:cytochrome c oxidase assembly factor CtaG
MSTGVHLHVLLTGVQTDRLAVTADVLNLLAVLAYLAGVRRLARRGRRWSPTATACFLGGMACLWMAVGSGLAAYDDEVAAVHMVQHGLLMMVAPPLLALGRPVTLATQALRRPAQVRIVRLVHRPIFGSLTHPGAGWLLYYGSMSVCLLDRRVYDYLLGHPLAHDGSHFVLLIIGYLYWQPLLGADPSPWRLSAQFRLTSALAGGTVECVLGILILAGAGAITAGATSAAAAFLIVSLSTCGLCCPVLVRRGMTRAGRGQPATAG